MRKLDDVRIQAALWAGLYLVLTLAPLAALLWATTPAKGGYWWEVGIACGFAALSMMAIQFVLTARFRRAVAPFGIDVIYYFHRAIAYVLLGLVLAHPLLLFAVQPERFTRLRSVAADGPLATGTVALVALLVLVATSAWRRPLHLPYGWWRPLHLVLALLALGAGFAHLQVIGYYSAVPILHGLWTAVAVSIIAIVVWARLVRPAWLARRPYRVRTVTPTAGATWILELAPEGHAGLRFAPGQFAWLSLGHSPFTLQEHPFTIASAPRIDGSLVFAIKALGDFTRTVGRTAPGSLAWVDGPYGAFTCERHPHAPGYVFIAGGIGVTPVLSMLEALAAGGDTRRHLIFAAHSRWDRIPCREHLVTLAARLDARLVHVLEEPPAAWHGERGRLESAILARHLPPDRAAYVYFLCGPRPMTQAVERQLASLGVPLGRIHTELFDMA